MSTVVNLKRDYGDFVIDIPKWEIADSGITALHGPSGSGKTSCFRLMMGLEPCATLHWNFKGMDLASLPVQKRRLGVVFQSLELFPHMTARGNILFAAKARKVENVSSRLEDLINRLGLETFVDRPVAVLSGGEKQRVALARALVGDPKFLFLDEPFSSLDSNLRQEARSLVKDVILAYDIPTLLITHDKEDLDVLADQVVHIEDGRLVNKL